MGAPSSLSFFPPGQDFGSTFRWGFDLRSQLLFDLVQFEAIRYRHKVDGYTEVITSSRTVNTVRIRFTVLGEITIDNNVDSLSFNTSGEQI